MSTQRIRSCVECGRPFHLLTWWQKWLNVGWDVTAQWDPITFCSRDCCEMNLVKWANRFKKNKNGLTLIKGGKK